MGVYIKDMEVPKSCWGCPVADSEAFCPLIPDGTLDADREGLLDGCPLVPVPPHGRLGDLDALKERITKRLYSSNHGSMAEAYYAALIDLIDTAPTIIPAEEG